MLSVSFQVNSKSLEATSTAYHGAAVHIEEIHSCSANRCPSPNSRLVDHKMFQPFITARVE